MDAFLTHPPSSPPVKEPPKKKRKAKAPKGPTLEQERRRMGDIIKSHICVEKWTIEADTHCVVDINMKVFCDLVVPNAQDVFPSDFDESTPIVLATIVGSQAAGEIFGKTKIKGGTRLGSWSAEKMDLIYLPSQGKMRCWWTMSGGSMW